MSKDTIKKVKKQSIEWEKKFRIEYPEYKKNSKNSKLRLHNRCNLKIKNNLRRENALE